MKRDGDAQPLRVTTTNAFASRWLVPRLPRWRKARPNAPLDVIGTDGVLDLHAGDADVAIRYARTLPTDGLAEEFLSDSFWPVCSPELLASGLKRAADLRGQVLVHCWWSPSDAGAPTWQRWLAAARRKWRDVPEFKDMDHLSFREELHAIEAVIAGQGIGIFSDVLVARELAAGTLVRPFDLSSAGISLLSRSHARSSAQRRPSRPSRCGCSQSYKPVAVRPKRVKRRLRGAMSVRVPATMALISTDSAWLKPLN